MPSFLSSHRQEPSPYRELKGSPPLFFRRTPLPRGIGSRVFFLTRSSRAFLFPVRRRQGTFFFLFFSFWNKKTFFFYFARRDFSLSKDDPGLVSLLGKTKMLLQLQAFCPFRDGPPD